VRSDHVRLRTEALLRDCLATPGSIRVGALRFRAANALALQCHPSHRDQPGRWATRPRGRSLTPTAPSPFPRRAAAGRE